MYFLVAAVAALVFACILVMTIVAVFLFFYFSFILTCWIFSDERERIDGIGEELSSKIILK